MKNLEDTFTIKDLQYISETRYTFLQNLSNKLSRKYYKKSNIQKICWLWKNYFLRKTINNMTKKNILIQNKEDLDEV